MASPWACACVRKAVAPCRAARARDAITVLEKPRASFSAHGGPNLRLGDRARRARSVPRDVAGRAQVVWEAGLPVELGAARDVARARAACARDGRASVPPTQRRATRPADGHRHAATAANYNIAARGAQNVAPSAMTAAETNPECMRPDRRAVVDARCASFSGDRLAHGGAVTRARCALRDVRASAPTPAAGWPRLRSHNCAAAKRSRGLLLRAGGLVRRGSALGPAQTRASERAFESLDASRAVAPPRRKRSAQRSWRVGHLDDSWAASRLAMARQVAQKRGFAALGRATCVRKHPTGYDVVRPWPLQRRHLGNVLRRVEGSPSS